MLEVSQRVPGVKPALDRAGPLEVEHRWIEAGVKHTVTWDRHLEGAEPIIVKSNVDHRFRERESGESLLGEDERSGKDRALVAVKPAGRTVVPECDRAPEPFVEQDDTFGFQRRKRPFGDPPQPEQRVEEALSLLKIFHE